MTGGNSPPFGLRRGAQADLKVRLYDLAIRLYDLLRLGVEAWLQPRPTDLRRVRVRGPGATGA